MLNTAIIQEKLMPIAENYGLKRVFLFGSYAKGTANEASDVDILIEKGRPLSLLKLAGMRQDVEERLQKTVDIVTTTGIDEEFHNAIKGTEILIYEK